MLASKENGQDDARAAAAKAGGGAKDGFFASLKRDAPAGLVVFLVALPLCLGIALASGAPLVSGLITGIVAGIVVAPLGGSPLSVSGPAAGLTVIVLNSIQALGSFSALLAALVLAGAMQIVLGVVKAGRIASYFPSSVIKGMLSGIGLILILKQFPHAVGYVAERSGAAGAGGSASSNPFAEIPVALANMHVGALIIGAISLLLLFGWAHPAMKKLSVVPGPLAAVVLGVLLSQIFKAVSPALALRDKQLVSLPLLSSFKDVSTYFTSPDWSQLANPKLYGVAVTLAMIASLETLLSVEAVDKLDPQKRTSDPNRELRAQGIGNMIAALLGGLPMTAVIVRSAANVNAGARTRRSAAVHGVLLLIAVLFIPAVLNMIPLAALAAVLIFTGYKLASVALFRSMLKAGWEQYVPYLVTIAAILATDLLKGIGVGLAVAIFSLLRAHYRSSCTVARENHPSGETIRVILSEHVSFLNKVRILEILQHLPRGARVEIDATKARVIDHDVLEAIHDFTRDAPERGISVEPKGIRPIARTAGAH